MKNLFKSLTPTLAAATLAASPALAQTAVYNATPPVLVTGQTTGLQADASGNLKVAPSGSGAAASEVQGNAASAATDSGKPVKIGGKYVLTAAAVTDGQRVDALFNSGGELHVTIGGLLQTPVDTNNNTTYGNIAGNQNAGSVPAVLPHYWTGTAAAVARGDANGVVSQSGLSSTFWNYAGATGGIVNTTTAVTIKTAAGAGVRNYLKTLAIDHDALGAATEIAIRDGAAGTVLWRGKLQTAMNEGREVNFDPPLKGTANTLMEVVTLTATVTGGVFVNATGFTGN